MTSPELAARTDARENGAGQYRTWCRYCQDERTTRPALTFSDAADRILIACQKGCPAEDVVSGLGLTLKDLFFRSNGASRPFTRDVGGVTLAVKGQPARSRTRLTVVLVATKGPVALLTDKLDLWSDPAVRRFAAALLAALPEAARPPAPDVLGALAAVRDYAEKATAPRAPAAPEGAEPVEAFDLTDVGNAKRFVARHGEDLRFCDRAEGRWLTWDGRRWADDRTDEARRRGVETALALYDEAKARSGDKALALHAAKSNNAPRIAAMLSLAECDPAVRVVSEALDPDPYWLAPDNETLDLYLDAGGPMEPMPAYPLVRPHRREDLLTKLANAAWDPGAACPRWVQFLAEVFRGDAALIRFVQKAAGYSLTGSVKEHCLFVLYGTGANGKTVFLKTLTHVWGDYATWAAPETILERRRDAEAASPDLARLRGVRLVALAEPHARRLVAEARLKMLTGEDTIAARHLFRGIFTFTPQFKLWIAVNHKPEIRGTDEGIWRRIRLIPFTRTFAAAEQDRDLPARLEAEAGGILRWAVEGCRLWQAEGLGAAPSVARATQEYRREMDALADFLEACCVVADTAQAAAQDLYAAYAKWCQDAGEGKPESARWLGQRLGERGFRKGKQRGTGTRMWYGLGLK